MPGEPGVVRAWGRARAAAAGAAVAVAQAAALAELHAPEVAYQPRAAPARRRGAVIGSAPQLNAQGLLEQVALNKQREDAQRAQARLCAWCGVGACSCIPWRLSAPPRAPACSSFSMLPAGVSSLGRLGERAERAPTCCPGLPDRRPRRPRGKRALRPARPPRPRPAPRPRQQRRRLPRCLWLRRPHRPASCGASSAARGAGAGRGRRHCSEVPGLCSCGLGFPGVRARRWVCQLSHQVMSGHSFDSVSEAYQRVQERVLD